ncbi:hypothetical protein EI94DRAFT_1733157 [Lactarius quietus]|nr:hypothetical protein EI94DRAFT_1733157 [Lactarius quietus]
MEKIREDLQKATGEIETDESIRKLIKSSPIRLKIQQFFYKAIHVTHKTGRYWLNMEGYEHRPACLNE